MDAYNESEKILGRTELLLSSILAMWDKFTVGEYDEIGGMIKLVVEESLSKIPIDKRFIMIKSFFVDDDISIYAVWRLFYKFAREHGYYYSKNPYALEKDIVLSFEHVKELEESLIAKISASIENYDYRLTSGSVPPTS